MRNMHNFPNMGTIKEAAAASGLAVYRVRQLVAAGKVKHINAGRRILVNLDSLAHYMEQGEPQEQTKPGGMWRILNDTNKKGRPCVGAQEQPGG